MHIPRHPAAQFSVGSEVRATGGHARAAQESGQLSAASRFLNWQYAEVEWRSVPANTSAGLASLPAATRGGPCCSGSCCPCRLCCLQLLPLSLPLLLHPLVLQQRLQQLAALRRGVAQPLLRLLWAGIPAALAGIMRPEPAVPKGKATHDAQARPEGGCAVVRHPAAPTLSRCCRRCCWVPGACCSPCRCGGGCGARVGPPLGLQRVKARQGGGQWEAGGMDGWVSGLRAKDAGATRSSASTAPAYSKRIMRREGGESSSSWVVLPTTSSCH